MNIQKIASVILVLALLLGVMVAVTTTVSAIGLSKTRDSSIGGCGANTVWDPSVTDDEAYFKCMT